MTREIRHISVLTGDLVRSRTLSTNDVAMCINALSETANDLSKFTDSALHFSRHRGDGWQVVLTKPEFTLRAALAFRTKLKALGKAFDSYIGIAEGNHLGPIPEDLNETMGQTFVDSGFALEQIKNGRTEARMAPSVLHNDIEALLTLFDFILNGWTEKQAEAIYLNLVSKGYFINVRAKELGITRQALEKRLKSAGANHVTDALLIWENSRREKQ